MNTQIKFIIDSIIKYDIKSVLNVGYRISSDRNIENYCLSNGVEWSVMEVFEPNCRDLRNYGHNYQIYNLDVKDIELIEREWEMILWLHGPEHVIWDSFLMIRKSIELKSKKITIYQAPIGEYPQDAIYGNIYEKHLSTLYPKMFEELGYDIFLHKNENENTFSAVKKK